MEITEVRVALRDDDKLKAFATITIDDAFVVRGLKIIEGANGTFVAMPSRKGKLGEFQDIAHPVTAQAREYLEKVVLAEYQRMLEERPPALAAAADVPESVETSSRTPGGADSLDLSSDSSDDGDDFSAL